ncbi:MAG: AMP-binding protein, partial [Pseudomonadota bacterium]
MNSFRFSAATASPVVPSFGYTRFTYVDHYRHASASTGMFEGPIDGAWTDRIEDLAGQYPDASKRDLTFAIIAVYAARLSEADEAIFPLGTSGLSSGTFVFEPCSIALAPDDCFRDVVHRVEELTVQPNGDTGNLGTDGAAEDLSYFVTVGRMMEAHAAADLRLHCEDDGTLRICTASNILPEAAALTVERMIALTEGIIASPTIPLVRQPIMSSRERKLLVQDWNATGKHYDFDGGLVAMMQRASLAAPNHPALIFMDETICFGDFNKRVNRLARLLRTKGVEKDQFVCLCMERGLEMVIAIWAVLKAGGAYVPLNVEDPGSRINEIILDCRPKVLLTQARLRERIDTDAVEIVALSEGGDVDRSIDDSDLGVAIGPDDLAYMIYTSGSTGKPKGVVVEHAAIHNRVVWMHEEYGLSPDDRVLQ